MLENALDRHHLRAASGRIVRCNRRFEEIFGYAPGELDRPVDALHVQNDEEYEAGGDARVRSALWRGETQ